MIRLIFHNSRDYTTNYDAITNACAALAFRDQPGVTRLRDHNNNVLRTISLDNMRRYSRYNIQLSANTTISQNDKNTRMTREKQIIDDAINNYKTTSQQYLAVINDLAQRIDPSTVLQNCQTQAQTAYVNQMTTANTLSAIPNEICTSFNDILRTYQQSSDAAYRKMGVPVPTNRK